VISEHDADPAHLYRLEREALLALLRSLSEEQLRRTVPATPAWSVHDVVAHVVGITADLNAQEFGSGDPDAWTAAQVATRSDRTVDELAAEWAHESAQFEDGLRAFGYDMGSHFLGDLLQHAQDVRSALDLERVPDDDSLAVALDHYLDTFHLALVAAGVGSVSVGLADDEWALGSGPVVAALRTGRFEAFRCLGGRRSATQVRALDWTGDVEAVLPLVSPYGLPADDVVDP
jgi:uncharacterized protein (TIGR03083 family)